MKFTFFDFITFRKNPGYYTSDEGSTDEEMSLVMRNFKKFMKKNFTRRMAMTRRSQIIEDAMSARNWATTLPIAQSSRTKKTREEVQGEEQGLHEKISWSCTCVDGR